MTRDIALAASNLLVDIELCDDVIDRMQQIKVDLEINNPKLIEALEQSKRNVGAYKHILENQLEAL